MSQHDGIHRQLERVRPPRVRLSYEVEVGQAIEHKSLPFVLGVIGDFVGQPDPREAPLPLKDRHFLRIDREGFDAVMAALGPRVACQVPNHLEEEAPPLNLSLGLRGMQDFRPEAIVAQVEPLRRMLALRQYLSDLRNKLADNEQLERALMAVLVQPEGACALLSPDGAAPAAPPAALTSALPSTSPDDPESEALHA